MSVRYRKYILVLVPSSCHRAPQTLLIFYVVTALGASFVLMQGFWVGSWIRAGHQKDQALIRSLEFSAPPSTVREGRGTKNGVKPPCEKASIKSPC